VKYFLRFFFILILTCIGYGFYHKNYVDFTAGNKIIGFSVLTAAFLYLPLFLYHRWKDKRLKDYTLTQENLERMKNEGKRLKGG